MKDVIMKNLTPSQQLTAIDSNLTKAIRIEGSYMFSNPAIDVVFDKQGNFYSNKKNDGYKLLTGKKVHYILNANGKIVKGNTTKTSLLKTLLGEKSIPDYKLNESPVVKQAEIDSKKMKRADVAKTASGTLININLANKNKIMDQIKIVELSLDALKRMIA